MAVLLIRFILLFSLIALTDSCFNNKDIETVLSVLKFLQVGKYILVSQFYRDVSLALKLKSFSKENISGIYMNFNDLVNYLENKEIKDVGAMIILKVKNNLELIEIMEVLKAKISDQKVFVMYTWMLILPENSTKFTKDNFYVPIDCRFLLVQESEIFEIYQLKRKSEMIYLHFGEQTNEGLKTNANSFLYERRMNLMEETMIMRQNNDKVKCRWLPECLQLDIWEDLGKILNFTTKLIKNSEFEKNNSNLMEDVYTDITVYHYTTELKDQILGPLIMQIAHLYIREIDDEKEWDAYLKPFHYELWKAVLFWILISSITIFILTWSTLSLLSLHGFSIYDQALTPLSAFSNQGCESLPKSPASRIARISAYIASAVIVPAYSASLISYITVDYPKIPFTDLESLSADGSYKLAPFDTPFTKFYFLESDDPLARKIEEQKLLVPVQEFPRRHQDAIKLICNEDNMAVINFNYRMFQFPSTCSILRVSDVIFEILSGIQLFNEGLHYKRLLTKIVIRFHSSGIIQKLEKINFGKTSVEKIQEFDSIGLSEVKSIMVFCFLSIFVSLLLFIIEWLHFNFRNLNVESRPRIPLFNSYHTNKNTEENLRMAPHLRRFSLFRKYQ